MLSRNSSSLSRSPTVKSSIDSLSCLEEAVVPSSPNRADKIWTEELSRRPADALTGDPKVGLKARLLLPPLLLLTIPCAWWYAKKASRPNLPRDLSPNLPLNLVAVGFWFDALALSLFFAAFLVSVRVVYRYRTLIYRLFGTLGRDGLSAACLKPVVGLLISDEKDRRRPGRTSSVVWTIGSRSKSERAKIEREGVIVYGNGDVYEGEFHQGRCSGSGVYYFYKSGRYEGQWVDGKYDGYGVETWARGSRYRGQYRKGLREGYGVYRFYTGDIYAGEWSNGQSHGCGVQTCEDGSRYVGEFKWGMKHGFGYYIFRNGDTYAGEYFTDKMHGYGVYQFANGHRYEGGWHEGKRQGLGLYTFRSGETQAGQWHGGVLQILSTHNPLPAGSVDNVVSHAKVLHIVQEARCAAEKAYQVPPVDDRVNRAVAAANRAANAARVASVKAVQKKLYGNTATTDM